MSLSLWLGGFILLFIPTLWAIIHIAHRDLGTTKKKALWGLFVVFVPPIGGISYLLCHLFTGKRGEESVG